MDETRERLHAVHIKYNIFFFLLHVVYIKYKSFFFLLITRMLFKDPGKDQR